MNKTIIPILFVSILLFTTVASASVSSVSTSASSSRATTGTSVTITATVTATGTESGGITFISTPSGITVSDPAEGQYNSVSLSTTPTTKTFTISAGTANTYSYYVTSGGTSSSSQTIVFVNPSTLTVSGSPSSTTKNSTQTFTLSISLQNSQSDSITTSYILSCPSGFSVSGDSSCSETKTTTISGGSTSNLQWTVTVGGTAATGTLTLQVGSNTNAFSSTVTCSNCVTSSSSDTSSSSTSSSGTTTTTAVATTKVALAKGKVNIKVPSIAKDMSKKIDINKTEDVAVKSIEIFVKNSVNNIVIDITKLDQQPAGVTQNITGNVYNYIQVDKTNITDADINKIKISFKVGKSWLTSNNINESTVVLQRYSGDQWSRLSTSKVNETDDEINYEAESPGLSVFAITGEKVSVAPAEEKPAEKPAGKVAEKISEAIKKVPSWVYVIVLVAIVAVAIYFVRFKKRSRK